VGPRPLRFFEGSVYGPVLAPYDYQNCSGARVAEVTWVGNSIGETPSVFHCYYNGGGAFLDAQQVEQSTVLGYFDNRPLNFPDEATYSWITDSLKNRGAVSIVECCYGQGRAILLGCHPEIPPGLIRWQYRWSKDPYLKQLLPELEATNHERLQLMRLMCEHLGLKTKSI
ncbi:MAG TPA: BPL-N domain-containing protein, partial [Opitutales bacterium]|nr:BPL-N domain-containing protein [Opitutales bacterium]